MTRTTNARIAGFTLLFYIAAGITSMVLFARATSGEGIAAQFAGIAQQVSPVVKKRGNLDTWSTEVRGWPAPVTTVTGVSSASVRPPASCSSPLQSE